MRILTNIRDVVELVVAGRPMLGKASELVVAGRPMLMLEVENEACERLVSRLWWYKCYRGTLLREGTPPVSAFALRNEVKCNPFFQILQ